MEVKPSSFVNNGGMKLPIGFRFHPTDVELILHYLKRKVWSLPLPASIIPDSFDVYLSNPWDLPMPGDRKEKKYFFSRRRGNVKKCGSFNTGSGYWKSNGKENKVVIPGSNQAIGIKKSLMFYEGIHPRGIRTCWVMDEYRLVGFGATPYSTQKLMMEMGNWVVCSIYQKKRKTQNLGRKTQYSNSSRNNIITELIRPSVMDFVMKGNSDFGPPQPSASSSSGITEVSSDELDQEATSSAA